MRYAPSKSLQRYFYKASISEFLAQSEQEIMGSLCDHSEVSVERLQLDAWKEQIVILKRTLHSFEGAIFLEFSIPRMGKRVDVVLIISNLIFVLEFKVGDPLFRNEAIEQVWDYALDLRNFHKESHDKIIVPVLVATGAKQDGNFIVASKAGDNVLDPIRATVDQLSSVLNSVLAWEQGPSIRADEWSESAYLPTPTIIEAAKALYGQHGVDDILKSGAKQEQLDRTTGTLLEIIESDRRQHRKSICFVTGVPGAGKTLVGLNVATKSLDSESGTPSVFLSGNGPLVDILREALTRDKWEREKLTGKKVRKGEIGTQVKTFIQNVHHFRNANLQDEKNAPPEHVAIFDEAQRAWNREQTAKFVQSRYGHKDFQYSEAEFLISCMDRHADWATVICLVGGGQEINTGEEGIAAWINAVIESFPDWQIYISPNLTDREYSASGAIKRLENHTSTNWLETLHLSVSMRSFRAENLSSFVKELLDLNVDAASRSHAKLKDKYPIVLTRDLKKAKQWLKQQARGTERYGLVVSSKAMRLKPHAIDVRLQIDHVEWFLNDKDDVRSSFYLEDAATEYKVQGLELDWACVMWDADFRKGQHGWESWAFVGSKWNRILQSQRKEYLKNAYRVLLTRARQGMIIVVPNGDLEDPTRKAEFYDETFRYLKGLGLMEL